MHFLTPKILTALLVVPLVAAPPKAKAPVAAKRPALKLLEKKLADFGIAPRSLAAWKTSGARPGLEFQIATFTKNLHPESLDDSGRRLSPGIYQTGEYQLPGFDIVTAPFFGQAEQTRRLALLRLTKEAPQASRDDGRTWVAGEKSGANWLFAFDGETLTLAPLDETFQALDVKAWALEKGTTTKRQPWMNTTQYVPFFQSTVVVAAFGRNEMQGILKYPGTSFVVPFKGVRFGDRWVARSNQDMPFNTKLWVEAFRGFGSDELANDHRKTQIELAGERLQLGTGSSFVNYALPGETLEQLGTAMEFDLAKGMPLPGLAERAKANLARSSWAKSDEADSFSREAEQAYVQAGLAVRLYPPHPRYGESTTRPILDRLKALGARVEFLKL